MRAVLQGLYPQSVAFRVYCDPAGGRVGSGGGTLVALMALLREEAPEVAAASDADTFSRGAAAFFSSRRVLLLHAGGESRRLPCYVPEGKLFAPLALPSASAFTPVVLDVLLSLYFRYPWSEVYTHLYAYTYRTYAYRYMRCTCYGIPRSTSVTRGRRAS